VPQKGSEMVPHDSFTCHLSPRGGPENSPDRFLPLKLRKLGYPASAHLLLNDLATLSIPDLTPCPEERR